MRAGKDGAAECDVFAGEWVYEPAARPLYGEEECPYIQPQLTCQAHGRPDSGYQHWRWQPRACSLPRCPISQNGVCSLFVILNEILSLSVCHFRD